MPAIVLPFAIVFTALTGFAGTQSTETAESTAEVLEETGDMTEPEDTDTFENLDYAEDSGEKHDLETASKFYFTGWGGSQYTDPDPIKSLKNTPMIGIDLASGDLYVGKKIRDLGETEPDALLKESDIKEFLSILKSGDIQNWKADYETWDSELIQDGYGWTLEIGYPDGSVERYTGYGTIEENAPKNFESVRDSLIDFSAGILKRESTTENH